MEPEKRHVPATHQPAKAWVQYQPLGVVGVIVPVGVGEAPPI